MEGLPPELLAHVFSFSDIRSLKKIRLVNTKFARIAAEYLFEEVCLTFIPRYLDKVTEVAFDPNLRSHVRTLVVDSDCILNERFADYETWEAAIDTREQIKIKGQTGAKYPETARWQCSQADLDRSHTNFDCLLASQKALFDGRLDLVLLSTALAMLPNLRTIKRFHSSYAGNGIATPYASIRGDEKNWTPILSDVQRDTFLPDPFIDPTVSVQPGLARPLASLICGLGVARKQIRTMELDNIPWEFWKQGGPSGFEHGVRPHVHVAFQYLESLKVHLMVDVDDLEVPLQGLMPLSISTCIGAAAKLRLLDVDFTCYGADDDEPIEWDLWVRRRFPRAGQFFATLTLPNLAIFRIWNCTLTTESLVGFFRRHTATLKEIRIDSVALDDKSSETTSWEKALRQIAPTLSLDSVELRELESDDISFLFMIADDSADGAWNRREAYCQRLTDYLYHRGRTECPRIADFLRWP